MTSRRCWCGVFILLYVCLVHLKHALIVLATANMSRWRPLHLAAAGAHVSCVRVLLQQPGCLHNWTTEAELNTPLHSAAASDGPPHLTSKSERDEVRGYETLLFFVRFLPHSRGELPFVSFCNIELLAPGLLLIYKFKHLRLPPPPPPPPP